MLFLDADDVLALYAEHVGARSHLLRPELLESAVALPQAAMFGVDLYPHLFQKAAALLRSLAQNQPFLDGNKRIAWIAARTFLAANGIDIVADTQSGLDLMKDLAERKLDVDGIAEFLARHAKPRESKV
ncbi:MAG: type II toxin-antitoxin system death-on-curing family toxin [Candidatus Cybelea sp.]